MSDPAALHAHLPKYHSSLTYTDADEEAALLILLVQTIYRLHK